MIKKMTPAERAITAFNLGKPDEIPHFEMECHLSMEFFGISLDTPEFHKENYPKLSSSEIERLAVDLADKYTRVYGDKTAYDIGGAALSGNPELDSKKGFNYALVPALCPWWGDINSPIRKAFMRRLKENFGNTRLFGAYGDGTFAIPDGTHMYEFAYRLADDPEGVHAEAEKMCVDTIEFNKRMHDNGNDVVYMNSDYCYNSGPFLSPAQFDEFITPYLIRICEAARKDGMYVIKHTDGNIMPILDSLVAAHPHAIHSLDPMAGVDIREVKRLVGDKVCLCGNVNCAMLQSGTKEQIRESAEYCFKYGGEGGAYMYASSNIPFHGVPAESYKYMLEIWEEHKNYN